MSCEFNNISKEEENEMKYYHHIEHEYLLIQRMPQYHEYIYH